MTEAKSPAAKHGWWHEQFLAKLVETRSVTSACRSVQIHRATAYEQRERNPEFRRRWDEAIQVCVDDLEASALKRAIEGTMEPLLYKGKPVMVTNSDGTMVPLIVRKYETGLTVFMLKALRPVPYFIEKQLADPDSVWRTARAVRDAVAQLGAAVPSEPSPDAD